MNLFRRFSSQVYILYLGSFSEGMLDGFMAVVLPLLITERYSTDLFIPSPALIGLIISLSTLVDSILLPFTGSLSDRARQRKRYITLGRVVILITLLAFTATAYLPLLFVLRILQGVGISFLLPASLALITEHVPDGIRASAMSVQTILRVTGGLVGPVLAGLSPSIGYGTSFFIMAITWLLITLLILVFVKDNHIEHENRFIQSNDLNTVPEARKFIDLRDMLILGAVMFVVSYGSAMIASLQNILNAQLDQTAVAFGFAYGATAFTRVALQLPVGVLVDRLRPKPFIIIGLFLMGLATYGIGFVSTTGELIIFRLLQGIGMTLTMVPILGMAASLSSTELRGRNMGISTSGYGLGYSFGPLITGVLASLYSVEVSFIVSSLLCFLVAFIVLSKLRSYTMQ